MIRASWPAPGASEVAALMSPGAPVKLVFEIAPAWRIRQSFGADMESVCLI